MNIIEQSQSVSSVPCSGWLAVSVSGSAVKVQRDNCGDTRVSVAIICQSAAG